MLALLATAAALAGPGITLHDGQTRYLLPSEARTGMPIACVALARTTTAPLPAPPANGAAAGEYSWAKSGAVLAIERRPNGSTQLRCGTAASSAVLPVPAGPFLIGTNGLARIRGSNGLARLERVYGPSQHTACRASWPRIGLVARFTGAGCSELVGATVDAPRWRSLSGVSIGDSVAKLVWEAPFAKRLSATRWRLAPRLDAAIHAGRVAQLVLTGS